MDRLSTFSGRVLNPEQYAGLEMAMLQIKLQENLNNNLEFWGQIMGKTQDYLICQYINRYGDFPFKRFYFCTTSDYTLRAFPSITAEFEKQAKEILTLFEGDPSFFKYSDDLEEEVPEDDEDSETPKQDNKFREIHRLVYTVKVIDSLILSPSDSWLQSIDHDCFIVPRGAYIMDASKKVIRNSQFQGLGYSLAAETKSYVHHRMPENPQGLAMMKRGDLTFSSDFMDTIATDKPKGIISKFTTSTTSH